MEPLLDGVKVLELGELIFVPGAGAVLADWGADVIKIEPPPGGDSLRSPVMASTLKAMGFDLGEFNFLIEQTNRGKRSMCLDLKHPEGRAILLRLVEDADVFLTSTLEPSRERLGITYEDLKAVNPRLIYARGHGYGQRGADAGRGGLETVAYFARSGFANELTPPGGPLARFPQGTGDITSGMYLAGGIVAALYRRTVTGEGGLVDVSLFGSAAWTMSLEIAGRSFFGTPSAPRRDEASAPVAVGPAPVNPLIANFTTSDGRTIVLGMVQPDRYWTDFCEVLGLGDVVEEYDTFDKRAGNEELYRRIRETFASAPLSHWRDRLGNSRCIWSAAQTPAEVPDDPQAIANGYAPEHPAIPRAHLVASPVQYKNEPVKIPKGAPGFAQHSDEILRALGLDEPEIARLKAEGVTA